MFPKPFVLQKVKVTVIIPVWNSGKWLPDCLASLQQQTYQDFTILLVDNGSTDGSIPPRTSLPINLISFATNLGFAAAVNAGIRQSQSETIALLNVDTRPEPTWLECLVSRLESSPPEVGSIASKMLVMEQPTLIDDAGDSLSWYGSACKRGHRNLATQYTEPDEVFSACAGAALYRRKFFEVVGLFDESYTSYFEDIDLGFRGRIYGYRCSYAPEAMVLHHGHSAGIVGGRYVALMTRNRLMTLLKNIPSRLWLRHGNALLFGQLYFFLVYKKPFHSLKGYSQLLPLIPHIIRERQKIMAAQTISLDTFEAMLSTDLGEPSLSEIIWRKATAQNFNGRRSKISVC